MKAFTLVEALIALMVLGIMITGIVSGFMQGHRNAEWSAYSLAAQSLAMQPVEQLCSATWDLYAFPSVDELAATNWIAVNQLDVPSSGTNIVYATNEVWVTDVSLDPPLKQIRVECRWRFLNRGIFTNTMVTYRAPDQ